MDCNKKPELTRQNSVNINVTSTFTHKKIKLASEMKNLDASSFKFRDLEVLTAHKICINQSMARLSICKLMLGIKSVR